MVVLLSGRILIVKIFEDSNILTFPMTVFMTKGLILVSKVMNKCGLSRFLCTMQAQHHIALYGQLFGLV